MKNGWPMVPLGEVLQLQRRWIKPDPFTDYGEIGVRSFGRGIFLKSPVSGASLGDKRVLRIEPGDLVFMNVFAWEGAVAVAGPDVAGKIGSHRFATYTPLGNKVDVRYINLFFKTHAGRELLGRVSPGSALRNRTMNLSQFAEQKVPLPPLAEQRRIVARIASIATKIAEARDDHASVTDTCEALPASAMHELFGDEPKPDWIPLGRFVHDIHNGWSPQCEARPAAADEWGVLKVGAVSFGEFDERQNKALPPTLEPLPEYEIKPGDFLMSRANTLLLVGACALVKNTRKRLILCDKIFRFRFKDADAVNRDYWAYMMKSPSLRQQIERGASGTSSTMKNISKPKILELLLPRHSAAEQRRIVAHLDALTAKTATLRQLQEQSAAELAALLPSFLDRAFRGEL